MAIDLKVASVYVDRNGRIDLHVDVCEDGETIKQISLQETNIAELKRVLKSKAEAAIAANKVFTTAKNAVQAAVDEVNSELKKSTIGGGKYGAELDR